MLKTLFVAWQDLHSRAWFPIGRLTYNGELYEFAYIQGVKKAREKCGFQGV